MRSKQQPRPSYRWLSKEENDDCDETIDSSEKKDTTRSSLSSSIQSLDNATQYAGVLTGSQSLPPTLVATAATAVSMTRDQERQRSILNSPTEANESTTTSTIPASIGLSSGNFSNNIKAITSRVVNLTSSVSHLSMLQQHQHYSQSFHESQQQLTKKITSPTQLSNVTQADLAVTSSASNLIDSHDVMGQNNHGGTSIQSLNVERELASPRCQSRDSSSGGRCPSDDSNYSGNGGSTMAPTPTSPIGIALPATLPPGAAAALLPPQSAAMAAYLNVAAAAAQQNRLLLGNPLAAAAGLVRAAHSPSNLPQLSSPIPDEAPVLDFSTKREHHRDSDTDSKSDSDAVNLSKPDNCPLDLSVSSRKRYSDNDNNQSSTRKVSRPTDYKPVVSPWTTPMTPYFAAAVAAASLSPKNPLPVDWNGKTKLTATDATKALEKMSEMTRLGVEQEISGRTSGSQTSSSTSRHSAWQSHWLNKGADAVKDVFKCVWCKQSFPTLATLTTHMKETQHCGVNVPPSSNAGGGQQSHHHHHHHHHQSQSSVSSNSSSNKSDLNLLIKETMPLPRKLVRGQDVWLGKGAEQTRQILKCMWCGQSFRSLAEMTSHMQQTQHYTNIISQEQIISWKSSEDGKIGSGGSNNSGAASNSNSGTNSTVSAVLTCKVCDQAFSSLKDLSNHMVKNAHYKEHIMRSITESGGRRRQTREKRKKSLPVRKLLELERAQHEFKNGDMKSMRDLGSTRITCEKCGDKIETALFVEHIRQCVGGLIPTSPRGMIKPSLSANSIIPPDSISPLTPNSRDGRKSIGDESTSPASNRHISPHAPDAPSPSPKDNSSTSGEKMSSPSVLNAIEQLIEKSFDTRSRHSSSGFTANNHNTAPLGSSILKRLGIDESVDYTKPLIDPQTMNLLRSYQQQHYVKRERSGSESSSVSDRGSSRLESLTPERKSEFSNHITPRQSPDKNIQQSDIEEEKRDNFKIKRELINDDGDSSDGHEGDTNEKAETSKIETSDDFHSNETEGGELDLSAKRKPDTPSSLTASPAAPTSVNPATSTPAASPGSDRSITPRSTNNSHGGDKKISGSSLNALSSMFDSLTGSCSGSSTSDPNSGHSSSKKGSSHPLAALQKLCDKTENTTQNSRSGSSSGMLSSNLPATAVTNPGNILAFSWACNDAVMTSDSIIKCAFCDTPFCSKGAYRHHLSKVHFVKDDVIIDPITIKSSSGGGNGGNSSAGGGINLSQHKISSSHSHQHHHHQQQQRSSSQSPSSMVASNSLSRNLGSEKTPSPTSPISSLTGGQGGSSVNITGGNNSGSGNSTSSSNQTQFEESPHSKFLKYTELAKQLSSKYV